MANAMRACAQSPFRSVSVDVMIPTTWRVSSTTNSARTPGAVITRVASSIEALRSMMMALIRRRSVITAIAGPSNVQPGTCVLGTGGVYRSPGARARVPRKAGPSETSPDWQPVIDTPAPPGYPHPLGATPLRVPLVPAYQPCTAPNSSHGAPLAFGSCKPPAATSPILSTGTPDANGAHSNMVGALQLDSIAGDPGSAANEADVHFSLKVQDVRCRVGLTQAPCSNANAQGGADYNGVLELRLSVRLTDRYNLPAPGGDSPGTGDPTIRFFANCAITSDAGAGSDCSLTSSFDTWYPGAVREGRRAVMELGQVEVRDGGSEGYGQDNAPFLRQGIFIP